MATTYPSQIDNLITLPSVIDGVTSINASVFNTPRNAIIQIESALGVNPASVYGTVRARLDFLEQTISGISGGGAVIAFGSAITGQTLIWNGTHWIPSTNFFNQNIQTAGEIISGPALSTTATTGLNQLTGKLIFGPISPLRISDPGQGIIYFDETTNQFLLSQNGSEYFPLNNANTLASGDLGGYYPGPTVEKINGATVPPSGFLVAGNVLQVNGFNSLTYGPINLSGGDGYVFGTLPNINQESQSLSGDLSGTTSSALVTGLQGITIGTGTPTTGQVLVFNGTYWTFGEPVLTLTGDVTGTNTNNTVVNINGASVPISGSLITGQVLQVSGPNSLAYGPVNVNSGNVTGILPTANQASQEILGDVNGTTAASTVAAIQGNFVVPGGVSTGQIMMGVGGNIWAPTTVFGDINSSNILDGYFTVTAIQGYPVNAINPQPGQFMMGTTTSSWGATAITGDISSSATVVGQLTVVSLQGATISPFLPTKGQFFVATTGAGYGPVSISGDISDSATFAGQLTVAKLQGVTLSGSPAGAGYALVSTSSTAATWGSVSVVDGVTISGTPVSGYALIANSGTTASWQVNSPTINGVTINGPAPTAGQVLTAISSSGAEWVTFGGAFVAGGDLTGTSSSQTVSKLQGHTLSVASPVNNNILVYDATATSWGSTQLSVTGDVTGTWTNSGPVGQANTVVVQLQGRPLINTAPASGQVIGWTGTTWAPTNVTEIQGFPVSSAAPQNQYTLIWDATDGYWKPETPLSGPPSGPAGGDLGGTYPNPTVRGLDGYQIAFGDLGPDEQGYVVTWSWIDGYFILTTPSSGPPSGMAGGDLSNAYPNPTVAKINGASVPISGSLVTGNVLQVTGTSALGYAPINLAGGANYITGLLPSANQSPQTMGGDLSGTTSSATVASIQGHVFTTFGTSPGYFIITNTSYGYQPFQITGDVSASVSTPGQLSVNKLKGITLGGTTPSAGYILTATSASTADWLNPSEVGGAFTAGGDLSGSTTNQVVIGLQTKSVSATAPTTNQSLVWTGSAWTPTTINLASSMVTGTLPTGNQASQTMGGDVTGTTAASTVVKLQGNPILAGVLGASQDGYTLTWVNADSKWEPRPSTTGSTPTGTGIPHVVSGVQNAAASLIVNADVDPAAAIAGTKIAPAFGSQNVSTTGTLSAGATTVTSIKDTGLSTGIIHSDASGNFTSSAVNLASADVTGVLPDGNQAAQVMGGDVSGTTAAATVVALQTYPVNNVEPTNGYVLTWDQTDGYWKPEPPATGTTPTGTGIPHIVSGVEQPTATLIVNADVDPSAAIAYSKLNLTGDVVNSDISATAAIAYSKLNLTGDIVNSDISSSAAIAGTKINPNFGSQVVQTTGDGYFDDGYFSGILDAGALTVTSIKDTGLSTGIVHSNASGNFTSSAVNLASGDVTGVLPAVNQANQTMAGDVTGVTDASTVVKIQGNPVDAQVLGSSQDGYVLTWSQVNGYWIAEPVPANGGPPSGPASGDLSGDYPDPVVIAIQGNSIEAGILGAIDDGYVLTWNYTAGQWQPQPITSGSVTLGGDVTGPASANNVVNIHGASVPAAGSLTPGNVLQVIGGSTLAYGPVDLGGGANYISGVLPASNQEAQTLTGDVTGTTAANTISDIQSNPVALGTLGPADDGYVMTWNGTDLVMSPPGEASYVNLTGDVDGLSNANTVMAIQNVPVSATTPTTNQVLEYNGSEWAPTTPASSYPPSGPAGGDLSGTYPNPEVSDLQGNPLDLGTLGPAQDGYIITWINGDGALEMKPAPTGSFSAGGDLTGSSTIQTIAEIQGNPVNLGTLGSAQDGYAMIWNNGAGQLEMEPIITPAETLSGDVIGLATSNVVAEIQSNVIDLGGLLGALQDGYVLTWNNTDGKLEMMPPTAVPVSLGGDVTGSSSSNTVGFRKTFLLMGV